MMPLEIQSGMAYSSAQVLITPKAKAEQPAPVRRGFFTSIDLSMVGRARNTTPAREITPPTLAGYQRPTAHTSVAGQLPDKEPKTMQVHTNGAPASLIPSVNWIRVSGIDFTYEATESDLRSAGILPDNITPPSKFRSCLRCNGLRLSRLKDGRLRLIIAAEQILHANKLHQRFMGQLLADSRLSLVKGEQA